MKRHGIIYSEGLAFTISKISHRDQNPFKALSVRVLGIWLIALSKTYQNHSQGCASSLRITLRHGNGSQ